MRHITTLLISIFVLLFCQACIGNAGKKSLASPVFEQQSQVRSSLDRLVDAYQAKNLSLFMAQVSGRYTGDADNLESLVRDDFSKFTNIGIRYTVNNISPGGKGERVSMAITFTRTHQVVKTGKVETVTGQTEMIFGKEDGQYRLHSMKKPLLFGL